MLISPYFCSIFSSQIKQLFQCTSLFPWKCLLLRTKRDELSRTWRKIFSHCLHHKKCFVSVLWLVILVPIPEKCINRHSLLLWLILSCAFLCKWFTASNFRHRCLDPTPFKVFPCFYQFARKISVCCSSKFLKFCNCEP